METEEVSNWNAKKTLFKKNATRMPGEFKLGRCSDNKTFASDFFFCKSSNKKTDLLEGCKLKLETKLKVNCS